MRISIQVKASRLPLDYRMCIVSFIKESLRKSDEQYFASMYSQNNQMKPFGFAVYLRNFTFHQETIHLHGLTITISSNNYEFMLHLVNGANRIKKFQYKQYFMDVENVTMLKERTIHSESVLFKTLSPILIESKEGKPVHPTDENYEKEINYYADLSVQNTLGRGLKQPLAIFPVGLKRTVVKETNHREEQSDSNDHRFLIYTAYQGLLKISGHVEDLTCLYQTGIGRRSSQGFGLLEVEAENA